MKLRFLLLLMLVAPLCAQASIANAGSCSFTGTSCALSATATGDLNIFWAYRSASTTAATLPAGYTNIGTFATAAGGVTGVGRLYCKVATSSGDTGSGTATNATAVAGLSYSGTDVAALLPGGCAGMGVAQGISANAKTSTTVTFSGLTGANAILNTSDWVAAFAGDSVGGGVCGTAPTGMTTRSATGDVEAFDTNGTVSSWSTQTCTATSGTYVTVTFALKAPAVLNASGPNLVRSWALAGSNGNTTAVNNPPHNLEPSGSPRAAVTGDLVVITGRYPSGASGFALADNTTGSWSTDASASDGTSEVFIAHKLVPAASVMTTITPGWSGTQTNWQFAISVWNNVATSSIVDGTAVCSTAIAPTTNFGSTIAAGSAVTTTANNDLVIQATWPVNSGNIGLANAATAVGMGDAMIGLGLDWSNNGAGGFAYQYINQATAGAIQPGVNFVQSTHDTFDTCVSAYKQGAGGSAPGAGISLLRTINAYWGNPGTTTVLQEFPTSAGNLLVIGNDAGGAGWNLFGSGGSTVPTDSAGNTWHAVADTVNPTTDPQIGYAGNVTTGNNMVISVTHGTVNGNNLLVYGEVTGADTSPLDTGATAAAGTGIYTNALSATTSGACLASSSGVVATFQQMPECAPTSGKTDLFFVMSAMGTGPECGNATLTWGYQFGTGMGDVSSTANGDGFAWGYITSDTKSQFTTCTGASTGANALGGMFKQAATVAQLPQVFVIRP